MENFDNLISNSNFQKINKEVSQINIEKIKENKNNIFSKEIFLKILLNFLKEFLNQNEKSITKYFVQFSVI